MRAETAPAAPVGAEERPERGATKAGPEPASVFVSNAVAAALLGKSEGELRGLIRRRTSPFDALARHEAREHKKADGSGCGRIRRGHVVALAKRIADEERRGLKEITAERERVLEEKRRYEDMNKRSRPGDTLR